MTLIHWECPSCNHAGQIQFPAGDYAVSLLLEGLRSAHERALAEGEKCTIEPVHMLVRFGKVEGAQ